MKIIIYGLGSGKDKVEKYLKDECEIVGYSDSYFKGSVFNNKPFYEPKKLLAVEFDFIIIAIGNGQICELIFNNLEKYKIKPDKIISFYNHYNYLIKLNRPNKIERVMSHNNNNFDGVIFGISHGAHGINPQFLEKSFYNFAVDSFDLFYNYKQLEYLISNYSDRIKKLKYVVLDMYSYTYFNYDASLSKLAVEIMEETAWKKEMHNLKRNVKNIYDIELEIMKINRINLEKQLIFESVFKINRNNSFEFYKLEESYRENCSDFIRNDNIISEDEIDRYKKQNIKYSSIEKNIYIDTERENIKIFESILKKIKQINKNIKIYIVLIPQSKVVEEKLKVIEKEWKNRFYNILNRFKEKYNYEILDFKDNAEISEKNNYYYDLGHLNYNGSVAFTKILNTYITD